MTTITYTAIAAVTIDNATINQAVRHHDPHHTYCLNDLLIESERKPEFASVFINDNYDVGVEEYDGNLAVAYHERGFNTVINDILRHLIAVMPHLLTADTDYFTPDPKALDHAEVCFYTHIAEYMPVHMLSFDHTGTKFNAHV